MKKRIILSALFVTGILTAQTSPSNAENYIYSKTYLSDPTLPNPKTSETVQYFDGLGRLKQAVNIKASPLGRDVVTHIEYDGFGRQVKDYLPVPQGGTMNGAIVPTPLSNATQIDIYGSEKIYAEKILENSPLDRIQKQIQVGNDWTNKPIKFDYNANVASDYVRKYEAATTWVEGRTQTAVQLLQYFQPSQLYKNTITDEDGNKTIEFKNGQGQTLLVRKVLSATENTDTYYVYNEYNQLAFVIPPLASAPSVEPSTVENLYYQYRYDGRNRLVEKKLPGKGWEYMVYDKQDRLVLTQDSNLREQGKWLFTKYDQFSRPIYTGILDSPPGRTQQVVAVESMGSNNEVRSSSSWNNSNMDVFYTTGSAYPAGNFKLLSVNYYDTYPSGSPAIPTQILGQNTLPQNAQNSNISTKSLPTASYVKNIEDDNWTKNYTWYDQKGRPIGSHSINHLGGYTKTESELDFSGMAKMAVTKHKRLDSDPVRVITENFIYDHQNRLKTHTHQVDSNLMEYLAQNEYSELSQLKNKKVGGTSLGSGLQQVDYTYNIRGWMTNINDPADLSNGDLFGYKIKYNNPANSNVASGKYNGNIAEIDWKNSSEDLLKRYNYEYDHLNRLKNAFYNEPTTGNSTFFDEYLTYDLNGNILSLKRNAPQVFSPTATMVDNLDYIYEGNRLTQIIENQQNSTGYEGGNNLISYDLNGNMTNMLDKDIQNISYNYLNLPNNFFAPQTNMSGLMVPIYINYLYRADGVKLRKSYISGGGRGQSTTTSMTDYLDGFHYSYEETAAPCEWCRTEFAFEEQAYQKRDIIFDPGGGIKPPLAPIWRLNFVPTAEGFYSFAENRYIYQYNDHLGNARLSYAKKLDGSLEITDKNDYYPFGLNHIGASKSFFGSYQKYKYNGKELQETGMYDYGARFYMPDIGRWGVIDPLAEKHPNLNPMMYAANNPMMFIDPDGRDWTITETYNKKTNTTNYHLTFTGALLNSSSNQKIDMKKFANSIQSQTEAIFDKIGNNPNVTISSSINIRTIEDKDDLKSTDTLIEIKDSNSKDFDVYKNGKTEVPGIAMNGKEISVNEKYVADMISGKNSKTMPHEIGHTGGLQHPAMSTDTSWFGPAERFVTKENNFMIQGSIANPSGPNVRQVNRMYRLYKAGKLNNKKINPVNER